MESSVNTFVESVVDKYLNRTSYGIKPNYTADERNELITKTIGLVEEHYIKTNNPNWESKKKPITSQIVVSLICSKFVKDNKTL